MARGHWLLACIATSILVIAPFVVGLLTNEWYVVESYSNTFSVGLMKSCSDILYDAETGAMLNTGASCEAIYYEQFTSYTNGTCERTPKELETRHMVSLIVLIVAAVTALIHAFLGMMVFCCNSYHIVLRTIYVGWGILPVAASSVALGIHGSTYNAWLFCDQSYCDQVAGAFQDCSATFGFSFVAVCCGAAITLVNVVVSLYATCADFSNEMKKSQPAEVFVDADVDTLTRAAPPTEEGPKPSRGRYPNQPSLPKELEDGDWEYDPHTGYYWSEERSLYFEPSTLQFYDPYSKAWYNPETQLWYKPLEEKETDVMRPQGESK